MKLSILTILIPLSLFAQNSINLTPTLPNPIITPGAIMNVTVEQITQKGYANVLNGGVRNVPESLKKKVFAEYFGKTPINTGDYEIDHLISLELGGSNDIKNLWPESYKIKLNARIKDRLEDKMAALIRVDLKSNGHDSATKLLAVFQQEISTDWTKAYIKYVGPLPR